MVREARAAGQTVFMTSHVMSEVQHAADRVAMIRDGRLVLVSDIRTLRRVHRLQVRFAEPVAPAEFSSIAGVGEVVVDGPTLHCTVSGSADAVVKAVARHTVETIRADEPDLEELFLTHYTSSTSTAPTPASAPEVHHVG